jgi:hypothetical protein
MPMTPAARRWMPLLLVALALATGVRTGIAAPYSRPLPASSTHRAAADTAAGALARAAFAAG